MSYRKEHKPTRNTSTRSHYGAAKKPTGITIHHWGSDGQKHENVVSWLRGYTGNKATSAHEVISAGLVTVLAPFTRATWHSGSTRGNGTTVGLECRPEMSDEDWATLVERCADIEDEIGSMKYYEHCDWKNAECPGRYRGLIGKLVKDVNAEHARRKTGKKTKPKPPAPSKPKESPGGKKYKFPYGNGYIGPKEWGNNSHSGIGDRRTGGVLDRTHNKRFVNRLIYRGWEAEKGGDYLTEYGNDGKYGSEYAALVKAFQRDQGLTVDGLAGRDTWDAAMFNPIT